MSRPEDRLRPFFLQPSTGDRLLQASSAAKIELHRWQGEPLEDGSDPELQISFELRGELPVSPRSAALVRSLLREFCTPRQPRRSDIDDGRDEAAGMDGAA